MALLFLIFALFFASCSEVGDGPSPNNSSGSDPDPISSSSLSSSSSSSSSFEIVGFEWIDMGTFEISNRVLTTYSVTWYEAKEIATALGGRLPTLEEWEAAADAEAIEQEGTFEEWTDICVDFPTCNYIYRKNFGNIFDRTLSTDPNEKFNLNMSFRIVK